jgi:branched-chain amino acid transport system substrate-binding protein
MERLVNRDKVDIIVGTMNSNVGLATMEIAANYGIPFVATCPAAQKIADKIKENPERYKFILKPDITATAHTVGAATAAELISKFDSKNAKNKKAIFLTEHTDWGAAIEGAADSEFKKVGWKVIDKQKHDIGETNFLSLLSKIKASDAELLVTAETSASAASSLAKQFLEQGLKMYLVQIYGPAKPGYLEALGGGVDGLISEQMIACHTKLCDEFTQKFTDRFGAPKFDVCGNMQYDMMYLVKKSYEKAGSFDKDKWIKTILGMRLEGTVGVYEFDNEYHQSKVGKEYIPTIVYQLQGGKWEYLSPEYMKTTEFIVPEWLK